MKRQRGGIEYRLVCAAHGTEGHRGHAYSKNAKTCGTPEARAELVADRNTDPVMQHASNRACLPWHVEGRFLTDWTDDFDWMDGLEP